MSGRVTDFSFSGNVMYPPEQSVAQKYPISRIPRDLLSQQTLEIVNRIAQGVGCILTPQGDFNGSALLISNEYILVPRHCFPNEVGNIIFNGSEVSASTIIDGELDPSLAFQGDYKILWSENIPISAQPVPISVGIATGRSSLINYQHDKIIYMNIYNSVDVPGNFASRSDVSSTQTSPGDSGGARVSLTLGAVHSMHQGESEGLKMNDIIHSLMNVRDYHLDDTLRSLADEVWKKINIMDHQQALYMNSSPISLKSHHVQPEGPPKHIPPYVYRWTDSDGEKDAKKNGIQIDPNKPAGSIPTLISSDKGVALRSGALAYYDRLLLIDTTLIPNLTYSSPVSSKGGHWQYNITCNIPKAAIQSYGRR